MRNRSISRQFLIPDYIFRAKNIGRAIVQLVLVGSLVAPLSGCEKSMDISDEELIERINECLGDNLTPGMAVACGNYQKECQRRGKKTGNYIC